MAVRALCAECKAVCDDVRMRTDGGAYGPVDTPTCGACFAKHNARLREEDRRLGFRTRLQRWERLTPNGAYSQVQG